MFKRYFITLLGLLLSGVLWAQSPQKMSYQAIVTDTSNITIKEAPVGLRISILQGKPGYTPVYVETHTPYTNSNGLISLEIGTGNALNGSFSTINWGVGPCFIKTEIDLKGATNYTITDTSELLSIPYALYSANGLPAGTAVGQMNYWDGTSWVTIAPGIEGQGLNFCGGKPIWGPCPPVKASVSTLRISSVGSTFASIGATISNDGGSSITASGVCWGTATNPTLSNSFTSDGTSRGSFTSSLSGLTASTTYYVKAYATNSVGTAYGNELILTTLAQGSINSIDGGNATNSGTLTQGTAASSVSSSISYTGGNGGSHSGQTITSTGVTGLTATLASGTFANGNGTLTYIITGTPTTSGTASFEINIGGQTSNLTFTVNSNSSTSGQYAAGTVHCSGTPTEVVDVTNPTTGKTWMDRNLGASQAATSSTDEASYGDIYQWGRGADGHQCRTSSITSTLSSADQPGNGDFIGPLNNPNDWLNPQNDNLWQGVNGINNPCPGAYRLPTETELESERLSWSSNKSIGAFASPLKFPLAGYRDYGSGSINYVGAIGAYWSSAVSSSDSRYLNVNSSSAYMNPQRRAVGFAVRCIKDESSTQPTQGSINTIDCGNATNSGTLTQGTAASGVSSSISYTGGNGGSHSGQTITSTGVTGLTATLASGTFASGNGTLTYTITGTPTTSGTASFAINIGGQTGNLTFIVNSSSSSSQYAAGTVHCSGTPTAVVDVTNPTTGKTWMDRNLGASQAATSSTDEASYGDLYQWGRGSDGHQCRTSATTTTLSSADQPGHGDFIVAPTDPFDWRSPQNTNLWQGVNGINNPCPSTYRLPTETELEAERLSWNSSNSVGAFASPLKLPMSGVRGYNDGSIYDVGNEGYYWSSSVSGTLARFFYFRDNNAYMADWNRAYGSSVRCIKDESSTQPTQGAINSIDGANATNSGTLTQGTAASGASSSISYTGGNGGSHSGQTITSTGVTGLTATLASGTFASGNGSLTYTITGTPTTSGTASFEINIGGQTGNLTFTVNSNSSSSQYAAGTVHCSGTPTEVVDVTNPTTGKTWMDRNLGASQAAASSTDEASYGDLYQWGRGADGHQCRTSATTTTLSTTDQSANGNFILASISPNDWRSPQNTNLWQGVNGVNNPCPSGYRLPTDIELEAERLSWTANTSIGAFASPLKLPLSGGRHYSNGSLDPVGSGGHCWSSSVSGISSRNLVFFSSDADVSDDARSFGRAVRCIKDESSTQPTQGSINTIDCGNATNSGTLTQGTAASGVSSVISYTGGNGGSHSGQTITSTGVTGLTATLASGTFANGNGTLTYTITGTPNTSGTASFAINIGGKSCTLNNSVGQISIGDTYQGGKIAYIFQAGDPGYIAGETHGIIAAPNDQSTGALWGCNGTDISGAAGSAIGTGKQNTLDIINGCSEAGIAAKICDDLILNGYSDWFLPSNDELEKLYINKALVGSFANSYYWGSSELGSGNAWPKNFDNGGRDLNSKVNSHYVRAVRYF